MGPTTANYNVQPWNMSSVELNYGTMCLQTNSAKFEYHANDTNNGTTNWTNLQAYAYHFYGVRGEREHAKLLRLRELMTDLSASGRELPIVVTEFNSHAGLTWFRHYRSTTPDDASEAAFVASQALHMALARVHGLYLFKMRITGAEHKNALVWAATSSNATATGDFSDTTLTADAFRLLGQMTRGATSRLFPFFLSQEKEEAKSGRASSRVSYVSSFSEPFFYLYAVNDGTSDVRLHVDVSAWSLRANTLVVCEMVARGVWAEVTALEEASKLFHSTHILVLPAQSSLRLAAQTGSQHVTRTPALRTCTARAGDNMQTHGGDCNARHFSVATSNTRRHEDTSVAIVQFELKHNNQNKVGFSIHILYTYISIWSELE